MGKGLLPSGCGKHGRGVARRLILGMVLNHKFSRWRSAEDTLSRELVDHAGYFGNKQTLARTSGGLYNERLYA